MRIRRDAVLVSSVLFTIAFLSLIPPLLSDALTGRHFKCRLGAGCGPTTQRSRRCLARDCFHRLGRYVDGICQKGSLDVVRHVYHCVGLGIPAYDISTFSTPLAHSVDSV